MSPYMASIDRGKGVPCTKLYIGLTSASEAIYRLSGHRSESDFDLRYGIGLVGPSQTVTLYQIGDILVSRRVYLAMVK